MERKRERDDEREKRVLRKVLQNKTEDKKELNCPFSPRAITSDKERDLKAPYRENWAGLTTGKFQLYISNFPTIKMC